MVRRCNHGLIEFTFIRPSAHRVYLVGDFNSWGQAATPMVRDPAGRWMICLGLPEGVYQFKYLADGEWFLDYAAFGVERGPYGLNSVVLVERPLVFHNAGTMQPGRLSARANAAGRGESEGSFVASMRYFCGETR